MLMSYGSQSRGAVTSPGQRAGAEEAAIQSHAPVCRPCHTFRSTGHLSLSSFSCQSKGKCPTDQDVLGRGRTGQDHSPIVGGAMCPLRGPMPHVTLGMRDCQPAAFPLRVGDWLALGPVYSGWTPARLRWGKCKCPQPSHSHSQGLCRAVNPKSICLCCLPHS